MGLLKSIREKVVGRYERGSNYELGQSLSSSAISTMFGKGGSAINVLEEYNGFAWRCINIRAELLADQDLFIERLVASKWTEDVNHEFNKVLEGGEGQYDQSELLEAWEKSMCLYGEVFWYFSTGESTSKPMSVYPLDPACMTVLVTDNKVTGYVYQKDTQRVVLDTNEVQHWFISDPRTQFRGYGPMQAAGWFVRSSRYTYTYINNFLEGNAIPSGVIVAKGGFTDQKDWDLFKQQWNEKYGGIENAGKTAFIRSADLDFVKTGLSLGEIDFEKMKNTSRDDVMVMFGISKPMMAIFDDINRASATTARQLAAITLTSPALRRLKRKLSKAVVTWYGKEYRVSSTNPIPEDFEEKITLYDKGVGRWFTVNEARAAFGKEPLEGGDVLDTTKAPPQAPAKSLGKITIRRKNNKADFSYEMKESFRSEMENIQVKYEQQFFQSSNKVLADQKERVLDQLSPKKVVDAHFDVQEEAQLLTESVLPVFILLAKEQGQLAASFVGNAGSEFKLTPVMEKYIAESVKKAALGFSEETQSKIAQALGDGLTEGESIAKIGKRINAIYDEVLGVKTPGFRTERLARTEVIKTSNEITEAAYKQSGVVNKKEWFANPGRCEFCASLNGSIVQLGGTFVPEGGKIEGVQGGTRINTYENVNHPPVHPSCRCTLIPVIED